MLSKASLCLIIFECLILTDFYQTSLKFRLAALDNSGLVSQIEINDGFLRNFSWLYGLIIYTRETFGQWTLFPSL